MPGLVVSKLAPKLVEHTLKSFAKGYVVITGTAGKSTTTKMVVAITRGHGLKVFTNPSTANIEQGFFSAIIRHGDLFGRVPGEIAILEMDEGHAAQLVRQIKPVTTVILNVFEDQLDRFVDPAFVREKLKEVALNTRGMVLLNGDDQNCLMIGAETLSSVEYFGLDKHITESKTSPLKYAPTFTTDLVTPEIKNVGLRLTGRALDASVDGATVKFALPSRGVHFALDAVAALACAKEILGEKFNLDLAAKVLNELPPVFSRGEIRLVNGEPCEFILVQNPISMQLNLDYLSEDQEQIFFAIGRDVHDPSWMWTVDLSELKKVKVVSGFNYADAALLLKYNEVEVEIVEPNFLKAIDDFFSLPAPISGLKTVVFSADAMRRMRRHLGFTDPEDVTRG